MADAARDPRFKYLPDTEESIFQSLLAVPLVNQGRVTLLKELGSHRRERRERRDSRLNSALSAASAVEKGLFAVGSRVIGAMNPYTTDEVELLSLIADLAAGALEKAMLYDGMQRQIAELSTLAEVSETVRQSALLAGCRALDGIAASAIQRPIHLPNPSSFSIPSCSCFASSGFSSAWRSRRTASF